MRDGTAKQIPPKMGGRVKPDSASLRRGQLHDFLSDARLERAKAQRRRQTAEGGICEPKLMVHPSRLFAGYESNHPDRVRV